MITEIQIKNIRGIRAGTVKGMTAVSVFVGPNNSGKSTVLDALYMGAHPAPASAFEVLFKRRDVSEPGQWFLRRTNGRPETSGAIIVRTLEGQDRSVTVSAQRKVAIACERQKDLLDEQANLKSNRGSLGGDDRRKLDARLREIEEELSGIKKQLVEEWPVRDVVIYDPQRSSQGRSLPELYTLAAECGLSDQVNGILSDLLPEVKRVELLAPQGKPVVYLSMTHGGSLPLGIAGDGVRLLVRLSMELAVKAGGLALLEEPETHLHPGAIRQAARAIHAAAGRDIQIALSTHSLELIDALLSEFPDKRDRVTVFRTALDNEGSLLTHQLKGPEAFDARMKISEDLR